MNDYLMERYGPIKIYGIIKKNDYCIIDSAVHGLFACFYCILYGLYICEMEDLRPIIKLGNQHLYFDSHKGNNVFEYFYKRKYSSKLNFDEIGKITISDPGFYLHWCRISTSEKYISNLLIEKYFTLKSPVNRVVETFCNINFSDLRILGVHFRGTDKIKETPLVSLEEYEKKIELLLRINACDKFFFATDELRIKEYMRQKYGNSIITYTLQGTYPENPTNQGLHFLHKNPYLSAMDALIECYVLSRCQFLLSSSKSSMSLFATFLNPEILHLVIEP